MSRVSDLTKERVAGQIRDALSVFVGRGRRFTTAEIAVALDLKDPRTVQHWLAGDNPPDLDNLFKLMAVLGPAFTNKLLALVGQGSAHRLDDTTDPAEAVHAMLSAVSALVAMNGSADPAARLKALEWLPGLIGQLSALQRRWQQEVGLAPYEAPQQIEARRRA